MDYAEISSVQKLFSLEYDLKGFFCDFKIYSAEEKSGKNSFTIFNVSNGRPEETLGFLIVYFDEREKMYKGLVRIPSEVKRSPLENENFITFLIQNFFNQKIVNFYFRKNIWKKLKGLLKYLKRII
jgi:hypothetical protein